MPGSAAARARSKVGDQVRASSSVTTWPAGSRNPASLNSSLPVLAKSKRMPSAVNVGRASARPGRTQVSDGESNSYSWKPSTSRPSLSTA
jgi:hypothetical protein